MAGAGPCGLRAAVELLLIGANVKLLEKREHFSRANILHLWEWVVQDLNGLGAKILCPRFYRSSSYFHVGTKSLQCLLLKVSLLLGAQASVAQVSVDNGDGTLRVVGDNDVALEGKLMLINASGRSAGLSQALGFEHKVLGTGQAVGVVAHFVNGHSAAERRMKERTVAYQFNRPHKVNVDVQHPTRPLPISCRWVSRLTAATLHSRRRPEPSTSRAHG